ncbi:MAG: GNAT family N-acetyltransferase [Oscillospiraceae bacterium]|nr:GNAT family N-acetyltransferase [Oscillospiraceae bacterium]
MNRQESILLFNSMHPNFFEQEYIRAIPDGEIFDEMILPLADFDADKYAKHFDSSVSFGFYNGSLDVIKKIVEKVDPDWVQYFDGVERIYCGYVNGEPVSFCHVSDMGKHNVNGRVIKVGGPGCVGTLPEYRDRGIGLTMVSHATRILKEEGYDLGYIHFTYVAEWYGKLGYKTVLRWGRDGIL